MIVFALIIVAACAIYIALIEGNDRDDWRQL